MTPIALFVSMIAVIDLMTLLRMSQGMRAPLSRAASIKRACGPSIRSAYSVPARPSFRDPSIIETSMRILSRASSLEVPPRAASYSAASSHIGIFPPSLKASISRADEKGTEQFARESVGSIGLTNTKSSAPCPAAAARSASMSGAFEYFSESSEPFPPSTTCAKSGAEPATSGESFIAAAPPRGNFTSASQKSPHIETGKPS